MDAVSQEMNLIPSKATTVEISTGKQTLIEILLSPLIGLRVRREERLLMNERKRMRQHFVLYTSCVQSCLARAAITFWRFVLCLLVSNYLTSSAVLAAGDSVCTTASQGRFQQLTLSRAMQFVPLLFSSPSSDIPEVLYKWKDGITIGIAGVEQLTSSDLEQIERARELFQRDLGPVAEFKSLLQWTGDPFVRSDGVNFVVYFFASGTLSGREETQLRSILAHMTTSPILQRWFLEQYPLRDIDTFVQALPDQNGNFERGLIAINLRTARTVGIAVLLDSLLRASLSPALLQANVRTEWISNVGTIKETKSATVKDFIAFVYCSGVKPGMPRSEVEALLRQLPN
jgi:hypothetical protein